MLPTFQRHPHALVFAVYTAVCLALYKAVFVILPLQGDNFYALAVAHQMPFAELWRGDPVFYPEWRPLAYATIWLEHRLLRFEALPLHFLVNLTLWTSCAWLVYRIVFDVSGRFVPALIAGLFLLLDRRSTEALTWIVERQTLLACVGGLAAVWMLQRARDRMLRHREAVVLALLLLAAGLGKEYGLAFAVAIVLDSVWRRRWRSATAAASALLAYAAIRLVAAGGAYAPFCTDMGFLFTTTEHCITTASLNTNTTQLLYNVVASTSAMLLSGLFGYEGYVDVTPYRLVIGLVFFSLAALAVTWKERALCIAAMLPFATGALSFMLFRPRNQLIGLAGVAILAGVGLARLPLARAAHRTSALAQAALLVIALMLGIKAVDSRRHLLDEVFTLNDGEPCRSSLRKRAIGENFAPVVKLAFDLPDPYCKEIYD